MAANKWMIDPKDAVMLLIDHQSGLFQLVRDMDQPTLRHHVARWQRCRDSRRFRRSPRPRFPTDQTVRSSPRSTSTTPKRFTSPRTGQINAWDNPAWVEAIEKTKRKTLLIAGTLTSVCMSFPTLSARSPVTRSSASSMHPATGQRWQPTSRPRISRRPARCRPTPTRCWPS